MRRSWQRKFVARAAAFAAAAFVALSFAASPARAQCGSPPDPRTNTAGYASWCSCMGGSYNYQTTACTGARGPSTGGGAQRGGNSWPAKHWYCRARASNGASGWGRYGDRAAAERSALSYCDQYAKGRACRVTACTYVGGTPPADSASPSYSAPTPPPAAAPGFAPFRQPTATCGGRKCLAGQICGPTNRCYDPQRHFYCGKTRCVAGRNYSANSACGKCSAQPSPSGNAAPRLPFPFGAMTCPQCYRKLLDDIRFGHLTAQPRSYITHAIAGYDNCKLKASGACINGERFKAAVGGCAANRGFNDPGVRACMSNVLIGAPPP
jgi:hypothetical protein